MQKLKTILVTLNPDTFTAKDIPRLRAYLSNRFPQYDNIHNHAKNGGFKYIYPELQFKFIGRQAVIFGFNSGFKILTEVFNKISFLELNHRRIEIPEKSIQVTEEKVGMSNDFIRYRFATPWMALNQNNFDEYKRLDPIEKEQKLNRILWGNLRTLAHAFNYWIEDQEKLKVSGHFEMKEGQFKGNTMLTFSGEFITNFHIPHYSGIGKQVARGYGAVKKIENKFKKMIKG